MSMRLNRNMYFTWVCRQRVWAKRNCRICLTKRKIKRIYLNNLIHLVQCCNIPNMCVYNTIQCTRVIVVYVVCLKPHAITPVWFETCCSIKWSVGMVYVIMILSWYSKMLFSVYLTLQTMSFQQLMLLWNRQSEFNIIIASNWPINNYNWSI